MQLTIYREKNVSEPELSSFLSVFCSSEKTPPADGNLQEADADTQLKERVDEPPQYRVLLLNDDYTTFDFVVKVLVTIFKKSIEEAVKITSDVHHKGQGVCGIYNKQIAETKVALVEEISKSAGYPLKSMMEEA
jgi:ATP-dependent Clp protease adaptor protein ClpS